MHRIYKKRNKQINLGENKPAHFLEKHRQSDSFYHTEGRVLNPRLTNCIAVYQSSYNRFLA